MPRGDAHAERRRREALVYQFFPRLGELQGRIGGLLSGGERQMLAIGSALVCRPELLLVDELSLGLAPVVVEDLMRRLVEIRRELGITILLVEQSAPVALEIADYGYVMENGRIVLDGTRRAPAQPPGHPGVLSRRQAAASAGAIATSSSIAAAGGGMAELEVERLTLRFGGLTVLDGVSLAVRGGRAVRADRPERRRQDQRAQLHQRHLPRRRARSASAATTSPAARRTRSRGSGSRAPSSTASCSRR